MPTLSALYTCTQKQTHTYTRTYRHTRRYQQLTLAIQSSIYEHRAEEAVRRALEKVEGDTRYLGARITSKFNYLPFGPLSAALVWPTLAATGALMLYEYQGFEVNRARFARRCVGCHLSRHSNL